MPSIMQRIGTPNARHNLDNKYRKHLDNVDPSLSQYNKVISRRTVEDIYQEYLQPAFEDFNGRQKRKDRRLDVKYSCSTYLEYQRALDKKARASQNVIDQKGRPPIREIIWQIGNPEQGYGSLGQTSDSRNEISDMLLECQYIAENRYKQLVWGDKVIHVDEVSKDAYDTVHGTIHLHSSFVPLCFQNKQGPEVQVAFNRCLKEMGFDSFEDWKHDLDSIMEEVLKKHGLKRVIMDNHEKHTESKEFHRQQKLIKRTKEIMAQKELVETEVDTIAMKGYKYIEQHKKERRELEKQIDQLMDTKYMILNGIDSIVENSTEALNELVEQTVDSIMESNNTILNNAVFYISACSCDELDDISEKGYKLKKQIFGENIDVEAMQDGLDNLINHIENNVQLSWSERQEFWKRYRELSGTFWEELPDLQNRLKYEIGKEYDNRRAAVKSFYDAQYLLRSTRSIFVMVYATIKALKAIEKQRDVEVKIEALNRERQCLIENTATVKKYSNYVRSELKAGHRPCEKYLNKLTEIVRYVDEEAAKYREDIPISKKENTRTR